MKKEMNCPVCGTRMNKGKLLFICPSLVCDQKPIKIRGAKQ